MGGIPEFPEYAQVDSGIKDEFDEYTARYLPYSDFNFVNILCWDVAGSARVATLNDNLVIRLPDYIDGQDFYSFLGDNEADETVKVLLDEAEQHTNVRKLRLVPEIGARALRQGRHVVEEDSDGHDYVVSLPAMAAKSGSEFRHLRREVNFFASHHAQQMSFQELDICDQAVQTNIATVFLKRETVKFGQQHINNHEAELVALMRLFKHADTAGLFAYGIESSEGLKAFIIGEKIDDEWCVGHFWKADTTYRGIYRYMMHKVAERLTVEGFKRMNIEQDLGIVGLKRMKMFLNPVGRLKKYTITDR